MTDDRCTAPSGCDRPAGENTRHVGYGRCSRHAGSTPNGQTEAERIAAEQAHEELGLPRPPGATDLRLSVAVHTHRASRRVAELIRDAKTHPTDVKLDRVRCARQFLGELAEWMGRAGRGWDVHTWKQRDPAAWFGIEPDLKPDERAAIQFQERQRAHAAGEQARFVRDVIEAAHRMDETEELRPHG